MSGQGRRLLHGSMLGCVSPTSARFWVRAADEVDVRVEVTPSAAEGTSAAPLIGRGRTSSDRDYTAVVEVSGLVPATAYRYRVLLDGRSVGEPAVFRTHPRGAVRFQIGFGGGAGFTPRYERMWTTIGRHELSAFLLLGDNVYIDDPTHRMTQQYCYYRRQSQAEWRDFVASTSIFSIYDDHDFGTNDCVPGADVERPAWKRDVLQVFRDNWNNPASGGGPARPGCWYDFTLGDVHFIMLDGRYYRDLQAGSMLGAAQKAWLFETLKASRATFKVLASPVPWSPGVKPGSRDTWDGYPAEREAIFAFVEKHRIDGVILMAADRHRSDLRRIRRPNGYDLYEVMSSRLTNVHTHGLVKDAKGSEFIMGYNEECSFGLLDFDTTAADPRVEYRIVNIDNETIDSRVLLKSQLSHRREAWADGAGKTHLFILSGQSNMAGLDPKISFTPAVKKALEGDDVIVVKSARGGQPIRRWYKAWKPAQGDGPKADGKLYDALLTAVRKAIGDKKPDTITFVWMQGERDAKENHGEVYQASLAGLIEQLQDDLKHKDLNFVIGRLSDCAATNKREHWQRVRKAQVALAKSSPRGAWVDTDDLNGPNDGLHYTKQGYAELGKRFADKALKLLDKKK